MSTQLEELGIELREGYHPEHLQPKPDLVIIGNALSRGNPAVETVLRKGLLTPQDLSGWHKRCFRTSGSWGLRVLTVKPPPVPCWRGCSNTPGQAGLPNWRRDKEFSPVGFIGRV